MVIAVPGQLRPRGSGSSAPPRRAGSVRRTVTMDFTWPEGLAGDTVLDGRARDLRTSEDGTVTVLAEAALGLASDARRIIRRISRCRGRWPWLWSHWHRHRRFRPRTRSAMRSGGVHTHFRTSQHARRNSTFFVT